MAESVRNHNYLYDENGDPIVGKEGTDKNGKYVFKLRNAQKSVLCMSASYGSLSACQKALDSTYRFCVTATYDNL